MENYSFKTVTFGGFDKQDVIRYLEQSSEKAAADQRELEREIEKLRKQLEEETEKVNQLEGEVGRLNVQRDWLQSQLDTETAARKDLESLRSLEQDVVQAKAEAAALRPDAEAYARFRERLGAIECEARSRADDLEDAAAERTRRSTEAFMEQYQKLMGLFSSAADHVTQELQGLEKALAQLPQNMEETEAALNELSSGLQKSPDGRAVFLTQRREAAAVPAVETAAPAEEAPAETSPVEEAAPAEEPPAAPEEGTCPAEESVLMEESEEEAPSADA